MKNNTARLAKALVLLREFTGDALDFNLLQGNQCRQKRRQLMNALHGGKPRNVKLSNLKHDFYRAVGVVHNNSEAFVARDFEIRVRDVIG